MNLEDLAKKVSELIPAEDKKLMLETLDDLFNMRQAVLDNKCSGPGLEQIRVMEIWSTSCLEEFLRVMNIINPNKTKKILEMALMTSNLPVKVNVNTGEIVIDGETKTPKNLENCVTEIEASIAKKRNKLH